MMRTLAIIAVLLAATAAVAFTKLGFGNGNFSVRAENGKGKQVQLSADDSLEIVVCHQQPNPHGDVTLCGEAKPGQQVGFNRAIAVSCYVGDEAELRCCASGPPTADDPAGWRHCMGWTP